MLVERFTETTACNRYCHLAMRALVVASLCVVMVGCTVVRYTPSLDLELTEAGARYLETLNVVVVEGQSSSDGVPLALGQSVAESMATVTVAQSCLRREVASAFPYVFSLGVFPAGSLHEFEIVATVHPGEDLAPARLTYSRETLSGWIALVLWVAPGWEFEFEGSKATVGPGERAFYTVINDLAARAPPALHQELQSRMEVLPPNP